MDTLISNVTVVTMNLKMDVLFGAYIAIEDGKIKSISKTAPEGTPKTIIDGTGMVAIPGLHNCHTHLATSSWEGRVTFFSKRSAPFLSARVWTVMLAGLSAMTVSRLRQNPS